MKNALATLCCTAALALACPAFGFNGVDPAQVVRDAQAGNAEAQSRLGVLYAQGVGVPRDQEQALYWYRKAADQGHPGGEWNLAFRYVKGQGVPVDYLKARQLFRQAAQSGLACAQYDLGIMFMEGLGGDKDLNEATTWFRRAADQGYREAVKILKQLDKS